MDLVVVDVDIGRGIDQVAEYVMGLSIGVTAHALSVSGDGLSVCGTPVVGEYDGGLLVAQAQNEQLTNARVARRHRLLEHARGPLFMPRDIELDAAPSQGR